ncbi:beta-ketoacyl-[acyl-carrier-protein] synthase family protein [Chitinophaga silvatica]|uniref:Beta-ketoacyl-[acyl-carrier-protein] synthase family protein n=1 Tax=Chitinophaga silvatica TaxID=2282649 RepID=A0A3E1Y7U8_9BACT|nr:beta-ketoacyl-[acyl-carrier-protein] synthase family protein [Chitinophaga silvatica]RFS21122.1 beta-ketoacyl-[acyl-carrier-protein] synthase family protein [Chitinophaga silvatica]
MQVFVVADNIVSPLGNTTRENFDKVLQGSSGITRHENTTFADAPFFGALMAPGQLDDYIAPYNLAGYTRFEKMVIVSVASVLEQTGISLSDSRTGFIVSTTKGNIELLEQHYGNKIPLPEMQLSHTAKKIGKYFNAVNDPIVISSACISGLVAVLTGRRLIASGRYDHVVVTGADAFTRFVLSGFQSFQAVSAQPCQPFDTNRSGVTLGEGAATILLSKDSTNATFLVGDGGISNDANHISGPSRTGMELANVMQQAIERSGLTPGEIDFVSAHGTATLYNDEMEAKALHHAGLATVPVNSLKGYYGHTLGAAGLIEAIISMQAAKAGVILPTKGFETLGVSMPVKVANQLQNKECRHFLKTVSGFGGCNAAMVFTNI